MNVQSPLDNHTQVVDGCLVLALPAGLDSTSYRQLGNAVMAHTSHGTVKHLVVNMSAIDVVDSTLVNFLEEFLEASRLLGCTTTVAGIQPGLAMAMTRLQLSFGAGIRAFLSVDEAVRRLRNPHVEQADDGQR